MPDVVDKTRYEAADLVLAHACEGDTPEALVARAQRFEAYFRYPVPVPVPVTVPEEDLADVTKADDRVRRDAEITDLKLEYAKHVAARRAELRAAEAARAQEIERLVRENSALDVPKNDPLSVP